jgi:hypothetical protein
MSRAEASQILALTKSDAFAAFQLVERQLAVLVLRTQVLLSLSGIVVTVTGFSGRAIAQTSGLARASITAGILVVFVSAAVAFLGALRLRWLTQSIGDAEPVAMIERAIEIRDQKSRYLKVAVIIWLAGFFLYCSAIAQLLYHSR